MISPEFIEAAKKARDNLSLAIEAAQKDQNATAKHYFNEALPPMDAAADFIASAEVAADQP